VAARTHNFLPVRSEDDLVDAQIYVAEQAVKLATVVIGKHLSIDTITIFAQSDDEYAFIESELKSYGPVSPYSHGATLYVETASLVDNNPVKLFGVRRPDDSRPEVGYGDYPVSDYKELKAATRDNPHVREIQSGAGMPLLELRHPDFDVRGYIVAGER